MDRDDPGLLIEKIEPLEASKIWKSSALELKAFILLKQNKISLAKETFQAILDMKNSPTSLKQRAKNMMDFLED